MSDVLDRETIKALSTDTRQEIMKMLEKRPHTASEIAKITKKHVTTVAEHLEVLEKSSLVRKKESTNKWVYYELTEKGEHLFKPTYYSWVVVLSLSIVLMFVGFLRLGFETGSAAYNTAQRSLGSSAPAAAPAGQNIQSVAAATAVDYIGWALVALGIIGLVYLVFTKYRNHA